MGVRAELVKFVGIRGHKGQRLNGTEQLLFGVNRVRQLYQRSLLQANGDEKRQLHSRDLLLPGTVTPRWPKAGGG